MTTPLEIPASALVPLAAFLLGKPMAPEYPHGGDVRDVARDLLGQCLPAVVAAELRRLAEDFEATRQEWREEDGRTVRSSGLGHAVQALRARANELDPAGAR